MKNIKEEAERITNEFFRYCKGQTTEVRIINAKQCALICIDEIIKALENYQETVQFASNELISVEPDWYFYKQVKQYIIDAKDY